MLNGAHKIQSNIIAPYDGPEDAPSTRPYDGPEVGTFYFEI